MSTECRPPTPGEGGRNQGGGGVELRDPWGEHHRANLLGRGINLMIESIEQMQAPSRRRAS